MSREVREIARPPQARVLVVGGVFAGLLLLVLARAVELAVLRGPELALEAAAQHAKRIPLVPRRGPIVDRNGETLAVSVDVDSIAVRPHEFQGQGARVPALAAAVGLPVGAVKARAAKDAPFAWLKRQAHPRQAEAVRRLGLRGVETPREGRRFYPHGTLAAHVLGFVDVDSKGLAGIELRLDDVIHGRPRFVLAARDGRQREMLLGGMPELPDDGARVELTLDATIQDAAEHALAAGVAAARATGGTAVVLDPASGEVLALANFPTYDPNRPRPRADRRSSYRTRNRAITDPYEPGSTFKAMLAAAALEERVVSPAERLFCENGRYRFGGRTIHDAHPHGSLTFAEVIQVSSNICATKVAERLGRERYFRYLQAFGFGVRTGLELPGESPGILRAADGWRRIDLAVHSYGQGVSVTPLQLAAAFGAIANGGVLMRPYVVGRVVAPSGATIRASRPTPVRRVMSEPTARTLTTLLRRVVEEERATGTLARLEDFRVAGKTGTAQKVDPGTGAYSDKRVGSFVGFVPADAPRAVILVVIDEPQTSSYGGVVAAPVFRAIASETLKRLGVAPPLTGLQVAAATPRKRPEPRPAARPRAATPGTTAPSFLGLSLREVLARAEAEGWAVEVSGSGYVREQHPDPGMPVASDRRLALRLQRDAATY